MIEVPLGESGQTIQVGIGGTMTEHQIFDPIEGTWKEGAAFPNPGRDHMAVAVLENKIHLIGGRVDDTDQNLVEHLVYDAATDTWAEAAPLPDTRSAGAAGVAKGKIVFAGRMPSGW